VYAGKIVAQSAEAAFNKILDALKECGIKSKPRGFEITEIINANIVITNPRNRIIACKERNFSAPYAFGELAWYLSGNNNLDAMEYYSSFQAECSDDGETLNSAYGARIFGIHPDGKGLKSYYQKIEFNQWNECVKKLKNDRDTRQAIIHLHTPNDKQTKDEVCTLTLQFLIRNDKLHMITNMRSNDLILGFTYDVFAFTMMQELMANELGIELGNYYHNVGSMHVYTKEFYHSDVDYLEQHTRINLPPMQKFNFTVSSKQIAKFIDYERYIRNNNEQFDLLWQNCFENEFEALYKCAFLIKANAKNKKYNLQQLNCQIVRDAGFENAADILQIYCKNEKQNKKYIVEGPDAIGKSTFIKKFANKQDFDIVHFVKPSSNFDFYNNYKIHFVNDRNEILDRSFLSEVVYSKVLGRECMIDDDTLNELLEIAKKQNVNFIFKIADTQEQLEILKSRLAGNGDEVLLDKIEEINEEYKIIIKDMMEKGFKISVFDAFGKKS
jgi:thymidylate synthase